MRSDAARFDHPAIRLSLDDVLAPDILAAAVRRVSRNGGGPGGDGLGISTIEANPRALPELARAVRSGRYRPGPLRRVLINRPGKSPRPLAIPCVTDRVLQTAVLLALAPSLDRWMSRTSFAYRPGRSTGDALRRLAAELAAGRNWIADADIRSFFETIPHALLHEDLAAWIGRGPVLELIVGWIASGGSRGRGIAQGAPLSPLLANVYLQPLDVALAVAGLRAIRYADDFVVACRGRKEAESALDLAARALALRGLELARDKSAVRGPGTHFVFLGAGITVPSG
ncbi:reverse transcriptase domain-containing protein [Reyranella sp.]|uniref:reverse transcriptase domain-containing protein n=1 Tax=Reyranella sp. TaxID=1929291 RepID=UPI0025CF9A8C|nr:reverse transcriptase domain-containing protein [Reyranella sp.]